MLTIGWTLALYFARRFTFMVLAIFFFFLLLIGSITYLEYLNRAIQAQNFDATQVLLLTVYRVPSICEDVLPFTTLFGSIAAFVVANRRLEIVIARAAGISAWQFLLPACIVGLFIGVVSTTIYNPISAVLRTWADEVQAHLLSTGPSPADDSSGPVWLRQAAEGRESIIGAVHSYEHGMALAGVTAFVFEENGQFRERVDSQDAHFAESEWQLEKATITAPNRVPKQVKVYHLPTELSPGQVRQAFDNIDAISFWELPKLIEASNRARVSATRYELRYDRLLSRPIVLLSMVLLAAIVSLRFSRSRDVGNMILAGVGAGFMLYVVSKIANDLGDGGVVPPTLAAWLPAIVTLLVGSTVLLHLEDG
jgi:lipopolysaccharide export system permease protein